MSTQQLFDFAESRYRCALGLVQEMIEFAKSSQPNLDEQYSRFQFDVIVQYILLKIALADGKFLEIEGEFIDQITDNYDILQLFEGDKERYNWSFAGAHLSYEQVEQLVATVEKRAYDHILAFSEMFSEVDLFDSSKNYVSEIYNCIRDVASAFIMADGNATRAEVEKAVNVVHECLTDPWLAKQRKMTNKG